MLRMVFCDVDGTLLPKTETEVSPAVIDTLRRLTDKGVIVVLASGRPYAQLKSLFSAVAYRLVFLCLDGALVLHKDCVLYKQPLPRREAAAFLENGPRAVVHGRTSHYVLNGAEKQGKAVSRPNEISEDFLKIEVLSPVPPAARPWFRVAYAEPGLTELVSPKADKGSAARSLLQKFGVTPEEAMAFGDGMNDISLLAAVGHPYRMHGSPEKVCPAAAITHDVISVLQEQFHLS